MSHLDEGTLHSLLDGELRGSEVAAINAHLGGCSACALRLREAKEFRAEADRLIESVDLAETPVARMPGLAAEATESARPEPARSEPAPPEPARPAPAAETPRAPRPRPAPKAPETAPIAEPWNAAPPPLLIPDNEGKAERRQRLMRRLSIAATIVVIAGTGALAYKLRPGAAAFPVAEDSIAPPQDQVVSSLERGGAADTVARTVAPSVPRSDTPTSLAAAPDKPAPPAQKTATPPPAREPAKAAAKPAPTPAADRRAAQGRTAAPTPLAADTAPTDSAASEVPETTAAQDAAVDSATDQDLADVRRRASEALSQLDRDRRRNQAAAATAALDSARRLRAAPRAAATTVAPAAAPAPAPPPLTLEQRAGIYLRIGLDEASRQLGGPAHVIEGMSASFMGLAQGRGLGGADSTRPVVRVVYQDTQGRLVFLDQQRLRTGQAPPQGGLAWVAGETALWLRGEPPAEVLRSLRPRVR